MASEQTGTQTFNVTHKAPLDEDAAPAGVVAVDAEHRLHVVSTEPEYEDRLEMAAEMLNRSGTILLPAHPPDDGESRGIYKTAVLRTEPGARNALLTNLREKYGFSLMPAG